MNSTIAPAAPSAFTPQTLHARADTSANVDRVITITTSVVGLIIGIIGLILGYIYWKHSKKAVSQIEYIQYILIEDLGLGCLWNILVIKDRCSHPQSVPNG